MVSIALDDKAFRYWNVKTDRWEVEGGSYQLRVGASSADIRLEKPFEIVGDAFVDGKSRGFYTVAEVVE